MSDEHPAGILRVRELYRVGWKILRAARWHLLVLVMLLIIPWVALEFITDGIFDPVPARFLTSLTSGIGMLYATIAWTALFLNVRLMWKIPPEPKKGLMNREIGG